MSGTGAVGVARDARSASWHRSGSVRAPQQSRLRLPFADLSYRFKIPFSLTLVILVTALVVSGALLARSYSDLRADLVAGAESLGRTLSRSLAPVMLREDVWQAYEIVTTPFDPTELLDTDERMIVVLGRDHHVLVASHPSNFPMLEPLAAARPAFGPLQRVLEQTSGEQTPLASATLVPGYTVVAVPILSEDGSRLGTVLISFADALFLPRYRAILAQVAVSTLAVLCILVPIAWYAGDRMVTPLVRLTEALGRVSAEPNARPAAELPLGGDEIGRLGQQFNRMLEELEHKRALEQRMILDDRLAALGRLTAGIAHEINNPLGGMLNAINTQQRHGAPDAMTHKTLSLLERGLLQIKDTVGALLVEARVESRALTHTDIEDIRTLVLPECTDKGLELVWTNLLPEGVRLPSGPVRQVLINLLLNASHAARKGGSIACRTAVEDGRLVMVVSNDGGTLSPSQMERLFEPFPSEAGTGLGLWVTYQIVQQLRGDIRVGYSEGITRFVVGVPLE